VQPVELSNSILYGPVQSRRLGRSLGINILPFGVKVCSFNCNYCQLGWTFDVTDEGALDKYDWPSAESIASAVEERLAAMKKAGESLDCATFSGNGEPTLHPDFDGVVTEVLAARDRAWPGLTVDILSNGANNDNPRVVGGLNLLDERYMKLDAGTDETFLEMNSPVIPIGIWDIIEGLKRLKDCVIQSMFTRGRRDNTGEAAVRMWCNAVSQVAPKKIQIYTIARAPADARIEAVDRDTLEGIAAEARRLTGIAAEVY
jgi:wyosine [tRNA(Phe)-imidazoG37] synthetase (radical SAM superfamily)